MALAAPLLDRIPDPSSGGSSAMVMVEGLIHAISFHNPETGFSVLRVSRKGVDTATIVGPILRPAQGQEIEAHGIWLDDPKWGPQFKAQIINIKLPSTLEGIRTYLCSGIIAQLGPKTAEMMIDQFGPNIIDILDNDPNRIMEIKGIGQKRAQAIYKSWQDNRALRQIMMFLQEHGLGNANAVKVYQALGATAVEKIKANPYCLVQSVRGIGFHTADTLAQRLGVGATSTYRIEAAFHHLLNEATGDGHTALRQEDLVAKACAMLQLDPSLVEPSLLDNFLTGRIQADTIGGEMCGFLPGLYKAEQAIAQDLRRRAAEPPPWSVAEMQAGIDEAARFLNDPLIPSQRAALLHLLTAKVGILCGGPGVGKTTITKVLVRLLKRSITVTLTAPTGRAAKRLSEATGEEASTVHRAIGLKPGERADQADQLGTLETDVLIIDEASMKDVPLMRRTLHKLPKHAALILIGDPDQLPSVGPGNVLRDMIDSGRFAVARLTEIHRQAKNSMIVKMAHRIIAGQDLDYEAMAQPDSDFIFIPADTGEQAADIVNRLVKERIPAKFGFDPMRDIQVISPIKKGPAGTLALNAGLQRLLNPHHNGTIRRGDVTFGPGDKVQQTKNSRDLDVYNGEIGTVLAVDTQENTLTVDLDDRKVEYPSGAIDQLQLAYATTVHRFQGSESPAVVIPLNTQAYTLLNRNLLFTALTRARKLAVIVGQKKAIAMAIRNHGSQNRLTKLVEILRT